MMSLRYYKVKIFVSIVLAIATVCTWLANVGIPNSLLKYLSPSAFVAVLLFMYDRWLWKLPIFSWLMNIPNIAGSYIGRIEYKFNGEQRVKNCKMEIRQSSTRIDVETSFVGDKKDEPSTASSSLEASIVNDERKGKFKLVFFYENQGSCVTGDTLNQHYGTNVLDIKINNKQIELEGYYFTNRKPIQTMGRMKVSKQ